MRVILLQALADHAGALGVTLVVLQAFAVHGGEDAAMDRLQAVAGIRQRAPYDHRHGIGEIGAAHLLFNVHGDKAGAAEWRRTAFEGELGILIVWHRGHFMPAGRRRNRSGKALPAWGGLWLYFTSSKRLSARESPANKSLFCLILWQTWRTSPGARFSSRGAAHCRL